MIYIMNCGELLKVSVSRGADAAKVVDEESLQEQVWIILQL